MKLSKKYFSYFSYHKNLIRLVEKLPFINFDKYECKPIFNSFYEIKNIHNFDNYKKLNISNNFYKNSMQTNFSKIKKRLLIINKLFTNYFKMNSKNYFDVTKNKKDIILTPKEGYNSVLIFMHGLGDSSEGFFPFFIDSNRPIPNKMKVILLNAPQAKVSINGGMVMNSWYDIYNFNRTPTSYSNDDVEKNAINIESLIHSEAEQKEISGDYSRIFLGGFSQGCFMSLFVGLQLKENIGGIVGLSGALFPTVKLTEEKKKLPLLLCHGKYDQVIHYEYAIDSYKRLEGFNYKLVSFDDGHTVDYTGIEEMKQFLCGISAKF
jgi:predicted esterase